LTPREKLDTISRRLETRYGADEFRGKKNPLPSLVQTILSQNTNDRNRDAAYTSLLMRFDNWEAIRIARTESVEDAIRMGGLAAQKAVRIQYALNWAKREFGGYDLSSLCEGSPGEVESRLRELPGVGPKTAKVVLMFSCGFDLFPMDTHVTRVCTRLGFIRPNMDSPKAHEHMAGLMPKGTSLSLHLNMIRLGREICSARKPRCGECPLNDLCAFGKKTLKKST
jgi:endonuclease-3